MATIEFTLSYEGELLIKKGDSISFQTPLYKIHSKKSISIPLAKLLGTEPTKIIQSLKKFVGDSVAKGDIIAESATFMSKKIYTSEYDGVLKEVDHQEGILIIEAGTDNEETMNSFFIGEVADVDVSNATSAKIKLKVKSSKEYALKEVTEDFGGEVVYCKDPIKARLTADEVNHKVVVDEKIPSYEQVKYEAIGAKGFVSLHTLPEPTTAHSVVLKNASDFETISENKLPYCLVNTAESKIIFYE